MGLLSGSNIIRALALVHLSLAYLLLTDPARLPDLNLIFILGEAMRMVSWCCCAG